MPKVAVCLSGCGFLDGAEIHESVLTLLALDQAGAEAVCCAPDIRQRRVTDHLTQQEVRDSRNVLVESARIARCKITPLSEMKAADVSALILPGGFGAALNLSSFGVDGAECSVEADLERLIGEMLTAGKPIGAICIAPATLSRVLGNHGIPAAVTIGDDPGTAGALGSMGVIHKNCSATDAVVDSEHRIVTTPAYMLGKGPAEIFQGISKCVEEVLKMVS